MHASSYRKMELFVDTYLAASSSLPLTILDFGSRSRSTRRASPTARCSTALPWTYVGLDIAAGHNVTVQVADAYDWP